MKLSTPNVAFDPVRLQDRSPLSDPARFPPGRHPYYVTAPRYIRTSAGIKALHLLCHALNRAGYEAYMIIFPPWLDGDSVHSELLTPQVTNAVIARHRRAGLSPIVVYPETISGNPWGAMTVVRYVLNFPGLLGGDQRYPANEIVYGYSAVLAEAGGRPDKVLFIPASDAAVFTPGTEDTPRFGACFYAMKYQVVHQGALLPETAGATEITRDRTDSQTPSEIAELFRRSEIFYAYENTALALEAALCLCPTVFLPNPWLTDVIATKELGWDGFAWGTAPEEIARAKATVHLARDRYLATYHEFWDQLSAFVQETQLRAEADARAMFPPSAQEARVGSQANAGKERPAFRIRLPQAIDASRWHMGFLLRLTQSRIRQHGIRRTVVQILRYVTIRLVPRLYALAMRRLKPSRDTAGKPVQRAEP